MLSANKRTILDTDAGARFIAPGSASTLPTRKHVRLRDFDYTQCGMHFVAICAYERRCLFGSVVDDVMELNAIGKVVNGGLYEIPSHYDHVNIDAHVVMPNHVHAIIAIDGDHAGAMNRAPATADQGMRVSLGEIARAFKARCTRTCRSAIHRARPIVWWQPGYYEHVLRNEDELTRIRDYIDNSPLQWAIDRENPERHVANDEGNAAGSDDRI
jgi:putative transposase